VARTNGKQSDFGGYLDIVLDTVVYAAIPLGIALGTATQAGYLCLALLLGSFYINGTAWLYQTALLEKHRQGTAGRDEWTTVTIPGGLVEVCWPFGISVRVERHFDWVNGSDTLRQRDTSECRAVAACSRGGAPMLIRLFRRCAQRGRAVTRALQHRLAVATQPAEQGVMIGALADLVRGRPALVAENALLRQQLLILRRSAKRPRCTPTDRALLVLLAGRIRAWQHALLIVQPDTLLRWHRELFRRHWRQKSRAVQQARRAKAPAETIALIRELAAANRLWGAERIRGELLKVGIRVAKTTVQRHMRGARPPHRAGQPWAMFLRNHASEAWACDFLPVTDLLFRPLHAFFVIAHGSRRVIHVGVTRHPTDAWVAQQLREATPFGERPRYLVRDRDCKYGPAFARVAAASGITELRTADRAPRQNATCERFLGSVRRECLDHVVVLGEAHLRRVLREYVAYFNQDRPHQGIGQHIPGDAAASPAHAGGAGNVRAFPVLGGLHHAYQRTA